MRKELLRGRRVVSVYFGGGTPYIFGASRIGRLLDQVASLCSFFDPEITIEANPESVGAEVGDFQRLGINRCSIGVQSFDDADLCFLERPHDAAKAKHAIFDVIAGGITNISIDLMYDLPTQTSLSWRTTLEEAFSLPITHLSAYNLTIEPKTAFYARRDKISASMPRPEASLLLYRDLQRAAKAHHFMQYEISAFCLPEKQSCHNVGYWTGREFLGFGPSAFSFYGGHRFSNVSDIISYCSHQESGTSAVDFVDDLSAIDRLREMIAVGLRMNEGIILADLEARWGCCNDNLTQKLDTLEEIGLVCRRKGKIFLTSRGRVLYDSVAVELI